MCVRVEGGGGVTLPYWPLALYDSPYMYAGETKNWCNFT